MFFNLLSGSVLRTLNLRVGPFVWFFCSPNFHGHLYNKTSTAHTSTFVDTVHFTDFQSLREKPFLWKNAVFPNLFEVTKAFTTFHSSEVSRPFRKFSTVSLFREPLEAPCIAHLIFESLGLLCFASFYSRYFSSHAVSTATLSKASIDPKASWKSQLWESDSFLGEETLTSQKFRTHPSSLGI